MKKLIILISFVFIFISLSAIPDGGKGAGYASNFPVSGEKPMPELKVFPNPVRDKKFTIEWNNLSLKEIRIINIAGKQVYEMKFLNPVHRFEANVGEVPDGIYFLKVNAEGNLTKTVKLLISKAH